MLDLLSIGTNRGHSMIGVGISAGLTGAKKARSIQDPLPALDLDWATDRSLPAAYGPTPSFSRASTATYFTSSGVLSSAAINGPRFDHVYNGSSWVSKGLLVEEQRTNFFTYSEQFDNAAWIKTGLLITANSTVAPDGTTTADLAIPNNSLTTPQIYRILASSIPITYSLFAKYNGIRYIRISSAYVVNGDDAAVFDLVNGTISLTGSAATAKISAVGNGWYLCSVSSSSAGAERNINPQNSPSIVLGDQSYNGTSGIYIWGAQLEAGAFPTSYIPTTTAAVTRSADVCQITGTDFSGFWNEPAGALVAEGDTPASGTKSLVSADNATANESTILRTLATDPLFIVTDGGVAQASIDAGTVVSGTSFRLAAAYTVNDFAVSKDGSAVVTDLSGTIPTPTQLNIGSDASGNYACGHIARLRYYSTRLTNSKLQELST